MKRMMLSWALATLMVVVVTAPSLAQGTGDIVLPAPRSEGGRPLLDVLQDRQSSRSFSPTEIPPQFLSDLLWAADGINRPESGKRTAPSARNWQEIDIYVVLARGAYLYEPKGNRLNFVAAGDLRAQTGTQTYVNAAPLNLVYIADVSRMSGATGDGNDLFAGADAGFISENVYLFCASEGLATVVRGSVDRPALATALRLSEHQKIVLAQTVGYPDTSGAKPEE